jgi:hypothetical protein
MPRRWGRKYYDSGNVPEYNYREDQPNPPENSVRNFRSFWEKIRSPSRTSDSSSLLNECIIAKSLTDACRYARGDYQAIIFSLSQVVISPSSKSAVVRLARVVRRAAHTPHT